MRHIRLALIPAAAIALGSFAFVGQASAGTLEDFDYDVYCNDDGGGIDFAVELSSNDPANERFMVELDGVVLDSNLAAGEWIFQDNGPLEDGVYQMWVKTDPEGVIVFGWQFIVSCDGPIVMARTQCDEDDGNQASIAVALWAADLTTFDVFIDGVQVDDNQESNDYVAYQTYGPYPLGDHLVDVYWLGETSEDPYFSATVTEDCVDNDSGAGIPDTGSDTAPLLIGATALTLGGVALLGARRLRRA